MPTKGQRKVNSMARDFDSEFDAEKDHVLVLLFLGGLVVFLLLNNIPRNWILAFQQWVTGHQQNAAFLICGLVWTCGGVLSLWKKKAPLSYGTVEIAFGLAISFNTLLHIAPEFDLAKILTIASATYIVSRGYGNIADERERRRSLAAKTAGA
jgi:hypothetical protein